jgi:6,7-dimethyl-8-ribityllumazine synthase
MPEYRGRLRAEGKRFAIVVSRFNELITERLLAGAREGFRQLSIPDEAIDVAWVPGALEIPVAAQRLAASGGYAAVITLGAVIRGATAHFDLVAGQTAAGVAAASRETGVPIMFGVLTTDTLEQAFERAGSKGGNKGWEAALGAVEMVDLFDQLPGAH